MSEAADREARFARRTADHRMPGRRAWWLDAKWLRHRNTVEEVHPLLVRLQEARGSSFMTCGHVLDVLDAKDPAVLGESWRLGFAPVPRSGPADASLRLA